MSGTKPAAKPPFTMVAILLAALGVSAVLGAYIDWLWWPVYSGLMLTLYAGVILLMGGVMTVVGRGIIRRIGLVILVVGVGLVAGQNLGPSREPLIYTADGTMTLRLTSPVVATATSPADCTNVASETEFQVSGDPNMRLDTPSRPFLQIYLNRGDRWQAIEDSPRKEGVRFQITSNEPEIPADGKPLQVGMRATETSTIEATFANTGGSLRFSGLSPMSGSDYTGESLDYAGTLEWTCGRVVSETETETP